MAKFFEAIISAINSLTGEESAKDIIEAISYYIFSCRNDIEEQDLYEEFSKRALVNKD